MESGRKYKVCIKCYTYNQEPFIEDALKGFAMQKTSFPYVAVVVDDASKDNAKETITAFLQREADMEKAEKEVTDYAETIIVPHHGNANCTFVVMFLKHNLLRERLKRPLILRWLQDSDYEALCEGDDYWTDENKLQKQADFMDAHPEYSMCFHNALEVWVNGRFPDRLFSRVEDRDYDGVEIFAKWQVPTASVMFRPDIFGRELTSSAFRNTNFLFGDIILFLSCAAEGKLRGMSDTMCVYRRGKPGMTADVRMNYDLQLKHVEHNMEVVSFFGPQYESAAKRISVRILSSSVASALLEGNLPVAREHFALLWKTSPVKGLFSALWRLAVQSAAKLRNNIRDEIKARH